MSQVYELVAFGTSPVSLAGMKAWLKVTAVSEDALIQALIDSATEWGEKYTGRDFRANQWKLLLDSFVDPGNTSNRFKRQHIGSIVSPNQLLFGFCLTERIELKRDPVDTVDSITHLVSGSPVVVTATDYYLKKLTQSSEILLFENKEWPLDTDNQEQAIKVSFTTKAYRCLNEIIMAIKLHVTSLYTNRGDCPDSEQAARESGATMIYDQFRISRV